MHFSKYLKLILILFLSPLLSCKSPDYKQVDILNENSFLSPDVRYVLNSNFYPNQIDCIAIDQTVDNTSKDNFPNINKSKLLREAISGNVYLKNYNIIDLRRFDYIKKNNDKIDIKNILSKLDCDALLKSKIKTFKNNFYIAYSVTSVEIEVTLFDVNSNVLWQANHKADSREGSIPLDPLSLLTGMFVATSNREDEVAFQMIDAVVRRTIKTLPSRKKSNSYHDLFKNLDIIEKNISDGENINEIKTYIINGNYEEALFVCENIISKNPKKAIYYFLAGQSELLLNDITSSKNYILKSISLGYEKAEAFKILGILYLKQGKISLANASFQKAFIINKKDPSIMFNLGLTFELDNNFMEAAKFYNKTVELAIKNRNNKLIYKSLKNIKNFKSKNLDIQNIYFKILKDVNTYLKI